MPRSGTTITITDKGAARSAKQLFGANKASVKIGVFGEKGEQEAEGGLTMAEIAAVHEFGYPEGGIPERSFLRSAFDANEGEIAEALTKLCKSLLHKAVMRGDGKGVTQGEMLQLLNKLGLYVVGIVQKRIGNGDITPELSEKTIARKGSSVPLIDTGQLRSSISHEAELNK